MFIYTAGNPRNSRLFTRPQILFCCMPFLAGVNMQNVWSLRWAVLTSIFTAFNYLEFLASNAANGRRCDLISHITTNMHCVMRVENTPRLRHFKHEDECRAEQSEREGIFTTSVFSSFFYATAQ